jgi:transcriptional regulator with XRE-family HTH domain
VLEEKISSYGGIQKFASTIGVSACYVSMLVNNKRKMDRISLELMMKILTSGQDTTSHR